MAHETRRRRVWAFAGWLLGRLVALALLTGSAWIVYDCASSDRFLVRAVHVSGNALLSQAEIESAASLDGANLFWVDRREVASRLLKLPAVRRVEVTPVLPDTVELRIVERQPAAVWVSGQQAYLVDRDGLVLKLRDEQGQEDGRGRRPPVAPGGPPSTAPGGLPTVTQLDGLPLVAGQRVDAAAVGASSRLAAALPQVDLQPVGFEWSREQGLEVPTRSGSRLRFDSRGSLDQQVAAATAIRDHLARTRVSAELIDVRFGDRPYYR